MSEGHKDLGFCSGKAQPTKIVLLTVDQVGLDLGTEYTTADGRRLDITHVKIRRG